MARISRGKAPGEVPEDGGLGNVDFNAGRKDSKFGYEILALWKLGCPITLCQATSKGFLKGAPQKYTFVSKQVCTEWKLENQTKVIGIDDPVWDNPNVEDVINKLTTMNGKKESKASPAKNLASQSLLSVQM